MSEDEVKPQSEEPTSDAVKNEDVKGDVNKDEKETNGDEEEVEENDKEEEEEEKEVKDEETEDMKEDAKAEEEEDTDEKPKPKVGRKKKALTDESETPGKNVPLYDQPLEMSGKRNRKKVERFIQEEKKEELKFDGSGTSLGDIPFIDAMITKTHHDELKVLHRVAFSRPGKGPEIKKNLRQFNGFGFAKDDKKFELKMSNVERIIMPELKKILYILGLERSGNKSEVVERLMEFMLTPQDTGKKPPKVKISKGKGRGRPKKGEEKSKTESADESDSDASSSGDDDDVDEDIKRIPEKKTPAKKAGGKKTPARKTPAPAKKAPAKRPAKKAEKSSDSEDSSESESDDEPLAKKVKQPPTDNELKAMVKKILDGANLEEVTMKSVCRQVFESYPDFDLTHKKNFIKETVKSIIS